MSCMVVAIFRDGHNLVGEGQVFIEDEAKVLSRVGGVKRGVVYLAKLLFASNQQAFSPGGIET